jgi:outer membrane receptor protein involved in Fe transport
MKPIARLSLALLFACGGHAALAQTGTPPRPAAPPPAPPASAMPPQQAGAQLRGSVTDASTGRPIAQASVAVWSRGDSAVAGGALTRADGSFRVEGLRAGVYYLRVSHLGHAPVTTGDLAIAPGATVAAVPEVRLAPQAVQLEQITATADAGAVRSSADRNVYPVRDMPSTAGGNFTDVLRNVPAVDVDPDGRVSLRGSPNVAVQINGRATPMRGDQLAQYLRQLPAAMVERVEVIPNPSAKYDPEGMAGIVNIVLKRNAALGLSGSTSVAAGTLGRYSVAGNLGYQGGPLTYFSNLGYLNDARETSGWSNRRNLLAGAPVGFLDQASESSARARSLTLATNAELKLSQASSLAGTLFLSTRAAHTETLNELERFSAGGDPLDRSDARQRVTAAGPTLDAALSFNRVKQPHRHEVAVDARFTRYGSNEGNAFLPGTLGGAELRDHVHEVVTEGYVLADLTRMLGGVRLETGYKGQLRRDDSRFRTGRSLPTGGAGESDFAIDEQVHAGYVVLTREFGKVELQGGARVEHTARSADEAGMDLASFTDVFPSALAAYTLGTSRQVKASYSRRIQRPRSQLLNPFFFYEDPLSRFHGNPELRPEYTDAFELGFQQSGRMGTLQLTPFYRRTTGAIRRTRPLVEEDSIFTSTVENVATARSYGVDANASLRAGWLTGSAGASAFQQSAEGNASSGAISTSGFGWSARANANVRLSRQSDAQLAGSYRAPVNTELGRVGAFATLTLGLRQRLYHDKLTVLFRVQDPFDMMRFSSFTRVTGEGSSYEVDSERRLGGRGALIAVTYTFKQTPRVRAPRQQDQGADPRQPAPATP